MRRQAPRAVFLGGPARYASVQIRCRQVARALGVPALVDVRGLDAVPSTAEVVVCVKPDLDARDLERLARRRRVLWDVHDEHPPPLPEAVELVCSTEHARRYLERAVGRSAHVIPHHHANLEGTPNPARPPRTVRWIGGPRWVPEDPPPGVEIVFSKGLDADGLRAAYRATDIAYNGRAQGPETPLHVALNPGLKALNAMGYGIPSISPPEPAYRELAAAGTILCRDRAAAAAALEELRTNPDEYHRWRRRAFDQGRRFHLERIAERYRRLLVETGTPT